MLAPDPSTRLARLFEASTGGGPLRLGRSWWGFGGVHGGLTLGMLVSAMQARVPGRSLRQVSAHFCRALHETFLIEVSVLREGRSVTWVEARALEEERLAVTATALFAEGAARHEGPELAPPMPHVPPPSACPVFHVPSEIVPFGRHTEIRPVGAARPYAGGAEAELLAWVRLIDDDTSTGVARLMVLMDALAPSYAAVLAVPTPIPTVTFRVTAGGGAPAVDSPWILLRARTDLCRPDGWLLERLDAWSQGGAHLGSGEQLRVIAGHSAGSRSTPAPASEQGALVAHRGGIDR